MKRAPNFTCLAGFLLVSGCTTIEFKEPETVTVQEVVAEVEGTIDKVRKKNPGFQFDAVELTLEAVAKKGASSSIDFWIVSAEASVSNAVTQTIYYKLVPKSAVGPKAAPVSFSDQLSEAIIKAGNDITKAMENSPTLKSEQTSVSLKFAVETSKTGSAKVELVPIKLGVKGTTGRAVAHTIKLTFK